MYLLNNPLHHSMALLAGPRPSAPSSGGVSLALLNTLLATRRSCGYGCHARWLTSQAGSNQVGSFTQLTHFHSFFF